MVNNNIEDEISKRYPDWDISSEQYDNTTWMRIRAKSGKAYDLQVTQNEGIGLSLVRENGPDINFDGHDEVFSTLSEALNYLEKELE